MAMSVKQNGVGVSAGSLACCSGLGKFFSKKPLVKPSSQDSCCLLQKPDKQPLQVASVPAEDVERVRLELATALVLWAESMPVRTAENAESAGSAENAESAESAEAAHARIVEEKRIAQKNAASALVGATLESTRAQRRHSRLSAAQTQQVKNALLETETAASEAAAAAVAQVVSQIVNDCFADVAAKEAQLRDVELEEHLRDVELDRLAREAAQGVVQAAICASTTDTVILIDPFCWEMSPTKPLVVDSTKDTEADSVATEVIWEDETDAIREA